MSPQLRQLYASHSRVLTAVQTCPLPFHRRVEPDVHFMCNLRKDPFRHMAASNHSMAWVIMVCACWGRLGGVGRGLGLTVGNWNRVRGSRQRIYLQHMVCIE